MQIDSSNRVLVVRNIMVKGNRHTKSYIIKRELDIKEGDTITISNLLNRLKEGRRHIYNTTLFTEVKAELLIVDPYTTDIIVNVKEKWYIYPTPEFALVDRSYDEWIEKYNGSLQRVNYGIRFIDENLTGRKDQLNIRLMSGYTQIVSLNYRAPYANSALTNGFSIGGDYYRNRQTPYKTDYNNNLIYYTSPDFIRTAWDVQATYLIRKRIKKSGIFGLYFNSVSVSDSLLMPQYNTHYFNQASSKVTYMDLFYIYKFVDVNNILYPLKGVTYQLDATKRGLQFNGGINMFMLHGEFDKYWSLGKKWYTSIQVQGKIKLPFNQPYINQPAMGYGNAYLRGLDYSYIDGVAYAIGKYNLKREIFSFYIPTFLKRSKTLNKVPFHIYAKTYADFGYCYAKDENISQLSNKFLYSGGFGIDILTLYDIQFKFEYSFNQFGQNGLYIHNEPGF